MLFAEVFSMAMGKLSFFFNHRIVAGILMLLMNLGTGFLIQETTPVLSTLFQFVWMRRVVVFAILYTATRDLAVSIVMLFIFIFLIDFALNERSYFCLLPSRWKRTILPAEDNQKEQQNYDPKEEFHIIAPVYRQLKTEIGRLFEDYDKKIQHLSVPSLQNSLKNLNLKTPIETFRSQVPPKFYSEKNNGIL